MSKVEFDKNLPGLQIYWGKEFDDEIEFLGAAALAGPTNVGETRCTAATCRRGRGKLSYIYQVEVIENSSRRLVLAYETNPKNWPRAWNFEKGELNIEFSADSREPQNVWFVSHKDGKSDPDPLIKGEDWVYYEKKNKNIVLTERPRISTSKLARPEQQALRNRLISTYGKCQITQARCPEVLEACHIIPVKGKGSDDLENALLLRRDLHALFDSGLLRFENQGDSWLVKVDNSVKDEIYRSLAKPDLVLNGVEGSNPYLVARQQLENS